MLHATLAATPTDDGVALALSVENRGDDPVSLSFRDGQRAEFVAERRGEGAGSGDGESTELWRYSDDRMFATAVGSESLDSGAAATWEATWPDPPAGEYVLRAWVTATDAEAVAETDLVVE